MVKDALRSGDTKEAQKLLAQAIFQKPAAHCFETLSSIITSHKVGDKVTYIVLRDGQTKEIELELEERTSS